MKRELWQALLNYSRADFDFGRLSEAQRQSFMRELLAYVEKTYSRSSFNRWEYLSRGIRSMLNMNGNPERKPDVAKLVGEWRDDDPKIPDAGDYRILTFGAPVGECNTHLFRKEHYGLNHAITAIERHTGLPLVQVRWYNHSRSNKYYCCVWLRLKAYRDDVVVISYESSGGGAAWPTYGGNALHISLKRALEAAGFTFTQPKEATCNIRLEDYFRGIMKAINQNLKAKEFEQLDFIVFENYP